MEKINIQQKLNLFSDHWNPRIIGKLNDHYVKVAKFKGEFIWHYHEHEDQLIIVVKGQLTMKFRDKDVVLNEGELLIIPAKVEHMPIAQEETHLLFVEPASFINTGNITNHQTKTSADLEII